MRKPISFYSEGVELQGDLYLPDDASTEHPRAGVVLCHGYTGVKDLYLPDNAALLNQAGYVVLTFDYKGWGKSQGSRSRLAPFSRVADVQAAMTFLGLQPEVDKQRIGLYGTSYGCATVAFTAAIDERARCVVGVVGMGHGARWMRSVRRPDEWFDLLERSERDRERRVLSGESEFVSREEILLPDRQSAELAAAARARNPDAIGQIPLEYIDETLQFHPEWVVDKIAPRPLLLIAAGNDRLVPPEDCVSLYEKAGEPKKLVILPGYGHYEVYVKPALDEEMRETIDWYSEHLPATL
ncbi:MAG: alpha/beta hydrolase [Gammaproteobacteria bacterium]|nr:alpha/beta hydrolase [Gammaproteobacteria bacterium]